MEEAGNKGHYFRKFAEDGWLFLREVIIGDRSRLTPSEVAKSVGRVNAKSVRIFKARAAFTKFEVVPDKSVSAVVVHPSR